MIFLQFIRDMLNWNCLLITASRIDDDFQNNFQASTFQGTYCANNELQFLPFDGGSGGGSVTDSVFFLFS